MTKEIATEKVKRRENESKIIVWCARDILRIASERRAENERIKNSSG